VRERGDLIEQIAARAYVALHRRGALELIAAADARRFLDVCDARCVRVLGIEGFYVHDHYVRPDGSRIADFSSVTDQSESVVEARRFIDRAARVDLMLDFTLAE
jgi:hypothetical protein